MNDVEQARQRSLEDAERDHLKADNAARFRARKVAGLTFSDSSDPTTGLQPAINSHDAWPYRPGPVVKPAGTLHPYGSNTSTDLAERRRIDEGETFVPRCTGCLGRLDPKWCGHIAEDDRDAR